MKKFEHKDTDFLYDNDFIEWRLFRTEEQALYWKRFVDEHPESREAFERAIRKFSSVKLNDFELAEADREMLLRRILTNVQRRRERNRFRRRFIYWTSAAAASIALLIVSTLMFQQRNMQQSDAVDAVVGQALQSNEIRLISGETVLELKQNAQIALSEDGRISVVVKETDLSELSLSDNVMNRLIVPSGKRSTLTLPDGTKIWLNSGTELDFPSKFAGNTREIGVKGEIYIEVAKGQAPFYANASSFRVRVHGTKFNISAYSENEENTVTLVEGSVEVLSANHAPIWLAPNEKVAITEDLIAKETVNVEEYISWKDGALIFNQTPISDVLKKIGRHYNVTLIDMSESDLSTKTCTGKLFLSDDFEEILISLSILSSTRCTREGEIVYLFSNDDDDEF